MLVLARQESCQETNVRILTTQTLQRRDVRATDSVAGCFERRIYTAADANHQSKSESLRPRGRQDNLADQPVADIRIRKLELGGKRHSHINRLQCMHPLIENCKPVVRE